MPRALAKTVDGVRRAMKRLGRAVLTTCGLCCECSTWNLYAPCGVTPNEICGDLPDPIYVCTTATATDGPLAGRGFLRGGFCWVRADATIYENVTGIDPAEVLTPISGCGDARCPAEPMVASGRPCSNGAPAVYVCAAKVTECVYGRHAGECYEWTPDRVVPVSSLPSGATILPDLPTARFEGCCECQPDCPGNESIQNLYSELPPIVRRCCCGSLEGVSVITTITDRAVYSDGVTTGVDIIGTVRIEGGQPITTGTRRDFDSRTGEQVRQLFPGEITDPSCGVSPTVSQLGGTFFPPGFPNVTVESFVYTCLVVTLVLRYAPPHVDGQPDLVQTTRIDIRQSSLGDAPPCTRSCADQLGFDAP